MLLLRQHRTSLLCDGVGLLHVFFFFLNSFHLLKKKNHNFHSVSFLPLTFFFFFPWRNTFLFSFLSPCGNCRPQKKGLHWLLPPAKVFAIQTTTASILDLALFFFFLTFFFFSTPFSFIPCRLITAAIVESSIHTHTQTHTELCGASLYVLNWASPLFSHSLSINQFLYRLFFF